LLVLRFVDLEEFGLFAGYICVSVHATGVGILDLINDCLGIGFVFLIKLPFSFDTN